MGLFGSIAGGITSAAGGILSAKAANKGYKEAISEYENRLNDIKTHRDAVYYRDPSQTAANQAAVTNARNMLDAQTQAAEARNVVAGGTDESVALQKQASAQAVGGMLQQQAAQDEAARENAWNTADSSINSMTQYLAKAKMDRGNAMAKNISATASGLSDSVSKF